MKRCRIDISLKAKTMLKEIRKELGNTSLSFSTVAELCLQEVYDRMMDADCFTEEQNPTQRKLDEILTMLQQVLPEI